jgi:hypothetical protein
VDSNEAKRLLQFYQPAADAGDPQFAEALAQAQRDPELARWFAEHCASYEAVRRTLRGMPVPEDLRVRILSRQPSPTRATTGVWGRPAFLLGALAAAVAINAVMYFVYWRRPGTTERRDFAGYVEAMTRYVATGYAMGIETGNLDDLRRQLGDRQSPTEFALTDGMRSLRLEGGQSLDWNHHKVSLICFRKQSEGGGEGPDVWLFVVSREAFPDEPAASTPQIAAAGGLSTASRSRGEYTYLLALRGARADVEKFL